MEVVNINTGTLIQQANERVNEGSVNKPVDGKDSQNSISEAETNESASEDSVNKSVDNINSLNNVR
jgi:hypothetical protein